VAFMLERPKNKKLKDFISDPKGILDAFMKQVRWNRPYAGRQIPVKSYGKPKYTNKWTDIYGRNWRDYEWVTSFDDRSLQMNCLHMPAGVFCMFDYVPYRLSELNRTLTRSDTGRVLTEFYGKLSDWKEWKTLPAEWQQELIPSNVQVQSSANRYTWNAGSYSGKIMKTDFDDDSEMTLTYSSMPNDIKKLRLRHVSFAEKNGDIQVGIGINQRPTENGHPSYREVWDKMIARKAPYNGQAQMQGKHSLIVSVLSELKTKTKSVRSLTKEAIPEQLLFSTCGVINSEGEATIKRICQDFSNDTIMRE